MTWNKLLLDHRVESHETSKQELHALHHAVARDLADAAVDGLSADTRFTLAYNGALLLAKTVIACAGYRVKGQGAHYTTFAALDPAMGSKAAALASYFNRCRRKRNTLTYDEADVVTDTEATELLKKVKEFETLVKEWIGENYADLT